MFPSQNSIFMNMLIMCNLLEFKQTNIAFNSLTSKIDLLCQLVLVGPLDDPATEERSQPQARSDAR